MMKNFELFKQYMVQNKGYTFIAKELKVSYSTIMDKKLIYWKGNKMP